MSGRIQQCCRHFRAVSELGSWLIAPRRLHDVLHAAVVGSSRGHRHCRRPPRWPQALRTAGCVLISIGENIVEQHAMPVADSFRWQQAVIDQTHTRPTPRRSAACWVVSFVVCGTPIRISVIVYSSSMNGIRPESASYHQERWSAQIACGTGNNRNPSMLLRTVRSESVGRGFESRPPHQGFIFGLFGSWSSFIHCL